MNKKLIIAVIFIGLVITLFFSFLIIREKGFLGTNITKQTKEEDTASGMEERADEYEVDDFIKTEENEEQDKKETNSPAISDFSGQMDDSTSLENSSIKQTDEVVEKKKDDLDALRQQMLNQ